MENRYSGGIREKAPSEEFRRLETEKSDFILQANWLKEQRKYREATEKFAVAAEIETKLSEALRKDGQMMPYFIHRFSAASCWSQAGNLYLAKEMLKELLSEKYMPEQLSNRIEDYLLTLEERTQNWLENYAQRKSVDIDVHAESIEGR